MVQGEVPNLQESFLHGDTSYSYSQPGSEAQ